MTLTDQSIAALRANHDRLAAVVRDLTPEQLTGPSAASEWTVADVLSHIGSGAEISGYAVGRAVGEFDAAPANEEVWDRWNALAPADQASSAVESDERLVSLYESLSTAQRLGTMVDLGFLPQPVPLATTLGMRLNEQALHVWDVEVALDPSATLTEESAELLLQHHTSTMPFLLGFAAKRELLPPTRLAVGEGHTLVVTGEEVRMAEGGGEASARFVGPTEAFVRLLAGRLAPHQTPDGVGVAGTVTLDELRAAFPGY